MEPRIGRYEIVKEVGRGAFAEVFEVRVPGKPPLALKRFSPWYTEPAVVDRLRLRFAREVNTMRTLDSKLFVPVLDMNLDDSMPWFVMPLATKSLEQDIPYISCKELHPELLKTLEQVLESMISLVGRGLVHRDIKPSNVLFIDNRWKLADFGLVKTPEDADLKTSQHSSWGTFGYAAPEQLISFMSVDKRADIYSFGCIICDIFDGSRRLPGQECSFPGPMGAIARRCTTNIESRYESPELVLSALKTVLIEPPVLRPVSELLDSAGPFPDWDIDKVNEFRDRLPILSESEIKDLFALLTPIQWQVFSSQHPAVFGKLVSMFKDHILGPFEYHECDKIARTIKELATLCDSSALAGLIVNGWVMATNYNRFNAMDTLRELCGRNLSDDVARCVVIELESDRSAVLTFSRLFGRNPNDSEVHPVLLHWYRERQRLGAVDGKQHS